MVTAEQTEGVLTEGGIGAGSVGGDKAIAA